MILGISGYATSGKDTIGAILVEEAGFKRYAFADILRECLYNLNPIVRVEPVWGGSSADEVIRVQDLVDTIGWDRTKLEWVEVRELLQRLGTDAGRTVLGENVWVDALALKIANGDVGNIVVTDCRFANEAKAVKEWGGYIFRVSRPGVGPANDHISEIGLDGWDFDATFNNDGTIEDLSDKVAATCKILYDREMLALARSTDAAFAYALDVSAN